jgi:hypothetical protein
VTDSPAGDVGTLARVLAAIWPFLPLVGVAVVAILVRRLPGLRGVEGFRFFLVAAAVAVVYLALGVAFGDLGDIGFNGRML